jgi:hypothetical protein
MFSTLRGARVHSTRVHSTRVLPWPDTDEIDAAPPDDELDRAALDFRALFGRAS